VLNSFNRQQNLLCSQHASPHSLKHLSIAPVQLSLDGKLVLRSYGQKAGSEPGQLHLPWHMAANELGGLFVVDRGNARVVLLNVELTRLLLSIHPDWVDRPWRLCYIPCDELGEESSNSAPGACARTVSGRLLVGTSTGLVHSYSVQLYDWPLTTDH